MSYEVRYEFEVDFSTFEELEGKINQQAGLMYGEQDFSIDEVEVENKIQTVGGTTLFFRATVKTSAYVVPS